MPRKTVITKEEFPPDTPENAGAPADVPGDAGYQEIGFPEDPNSIESFLSRIGNDAVIKVFRKDISGKIEYCGQVAPEYFSEDWLQRTYGAGDYSLKAMIGGRYVTGGSRQISIGAPGASDNAPPAPPVMLPNPPPPDPSTVQMEMMREEMRMQRDLMMKLIEKSSTPPPAMDLGSVLTAVAGLARMFVPAPQAPVNPLANVESVMNLISKGIEIGQTGSVEPKREGVMGWVKDLAPIVGEVISNLRPANGGGGAPPPRATVESPKQVQAATEAERSIAMLRAGITYLKNKALRGADPGLYIDFINDSMDDPQWSPLIQMVSKPYDELAGALDPELLQMPYRPWFETLFNGIKTEIEERSKIPGDSHVATDQPAAGETGDGDNA